MASVKERRVAWWKGLSEAKRREILGRQKHQTAIQFEHHHREDQACAACGTDASVGCVSEFRNG